MNFFKALTTFRDLTAQEFDFLPYLEQLEDLELGDCSEWETEVCMKYEPSLWKWGSLHNRSPAHGLKLKGIEVLSFEFLFRLTLVWVSLRSCDI
jgi:hypothetical protein